jgi:hypothetical protein
METFPLKSLQALLDYVSHDEERDYNATEPENQFNHIYNHIRALEQWEYAKRKGIIN